MTVVDEAGRRLDGAFDVDVVLVDVVVAFVFSAISLAAGASLARVRNTSEDRPTTWVGVKPVGAVEGVF